MSAESKQKQVRHIGFCPSCGNTAPQKVVATHLYSTTWYSEDDRAHRDGPDMWTAFCLCETCDAPVLYDGIDPRELDQSWSPLVYPRVPEFGSEVPATVRKIYAQASRCKEPSPLAFAILIRKALEAICDDRGIEKGAGKKHDLYHRLNALVARGDIPPTLAKMSDVLRTIGNTAAHDAPDEVTAPMTWAIDDFFQAIIEYVYIAPAKLAKFAKRLARKKKESGA
jgi:hypothetical protein